MSEKERAKKDHERTEKKNKARRDSENPRAQKANPPQQARDVSNLTDAEPGAERGADR
ncbi:MAG TPA: hypothetical protein VFY60_10320 [Pyrinomonadaceae bacterium]|nr:hypothetical protein [Pyrinomonadaceae bacterium]